MKTAINRDEFIARVDSLSRGLYGAMDVEIDRWTPEDDPDVGDQYEVAVLLLMTLRWLRALTPANRLGWLAYMQDVTAEMNREDRLSNPNGGEDDADDDRDDDEEHDEDDEDDEDSEQPTEEDR